jgi:excisionase family DNA binding protein
MNVPTGPLVPIEELSKHFSVSVSTIRKWLRDGHIPNNTYIKVGTTYRFSIEDTAAALAAMHQDSEPEPIHGDPIVEETYQPAPDNIEYTDLNLDLDDDI